MVGDVLAVFETIYKILGPVVGEMVAAAIAGNDPLAVLARERVEAIIPAELKSELALRAAKAARSHAQKAP
jgi:hypothetical protein